jgi:hypothetical protein
MILIYFSDTPLKCSADIFFDGKVTFFPIYDRNAYCQINSKKKSTTQNYINTK